MKKLLKALGVYILLIGSMQACAMVINPTSTWRYRVTVEIETPEGVKAGSAVHQLSNSPPWFYWPESVNPPSFKGEAVVIDLGERGKVFALLHFQSWMNGLYQAFPIERGQSSKAGIEIYNKMLKPGLKGEWTTFQPWMVTFTDLDDPMSVKRVYDQKQDFDSLKLKFVVEDHFEEVFGEGVKLKGIHVEITDDPVTKDILKILPWLPEYRSKLFDGRRIHTIEAENILANTLGLGSFKIGE